LVSSANGSAFFELEAPTRQAKSLLPLTSTIKLSCAVHGPKPLARNANFSPNLQLTASVKFAPFATKARRGYLRDSTERDLGIHLENALRGVIIQDRWPKSAIDVSITILEAEDTGDATGLQETGLQNIGLLNILAGCITVASAALMDARIDCLDLMTGGVAASVSMPGGAVAHVLDPTAMEHEHIHSACVVGYLPSRDEITEAWIAGALTCNGEVSSFDKVLDHAIGAARAIQTVLKEVAVESASRNLNSASGKGKPRDQVNDVEMK
jgi:exosome complex component MTR3